MQMVGISQKKVSASMLSSLTKQSGSQASKQFEKEATNKVLSNETFVKAMELLSKV